MLSVSEGAQLLGVSPARVRALIAEGTLPAQKLGRAWTLRDEDVLQRAREKPRSGRPRALDSKTLSEHPDTSSTNLATDSSTDSENDLHNLYLACRDVFSQRPDARLLEKTSQPEEASFYVAVADFFLQQKQLELVRQGVY
ncbi:MAG: helix-turn-helix domain-containing protein [Gordonibacter sp.]